MSQGSRCRGLAVLGLATCIALGATCSAHAAAVLTPTQLHMVLSAMKARGASTGQLAYVQANPEAGLSVVTSTSVETTTGGAATGLAMDTDRALVVGPLVRAHPNTIGTNCSGYSAYVWRTQYENNATGQLGLDHTPDGLLLQQLDSHVCAQFAHVRALGTREPDRHLQVARMEHLF